MSNVTKWSVFQNVVTNLLICQIETPSYFNIRHPPSVSIIMLNVHNYTDMTGSGKTLIYHHINSFSVLIFASIFNCYNYIKM